MFDQTEDSQTFNSYYELIQTKIDKLTHELRKCLREAKKLNLKTSKAQIFVFQKSKLRLEDIVKKSGQEVYELKSTIDTQKIQFMARPLDSNSPIQRLQDFYSYFANPQAIHVVPGLEEIQRKMKILMEIQAELVKIDTDLSIQDARQYFLSQKWRKLLH